MIIYDGDGDREVALQDMVHVYDDDSMRYLGDSGAVHDNTGGVHAAVIIGYGWIGKGSDRPVYRVAVWMDRNSPAPNEVRWMER